MLAAFARLLPIAILAASCSVSWLGGEPRDLGTKLGKIPQGVVAAISSSKEQVPITAMRQFRLTAGDELEIRLAGSDALLGVATVSPDGTATLPRRGQQSVAGQTLVGVAKMVEGENDAPVKVRLRASAPVIVVGAVARAGNIPYRDGLTLVRVLAMAGGATHKADLRQVYIAPRGEPEQGADFDPALPILPGDTVRLAERYF